MKKILYNSLNKVLIILLIALATVSLIANRLEICLLSIILITMFVRGENE